MSPRTWAELGPVAADAVPALEELIKDESPQVRRLAKAAVQQIHGQ
jgi:hypothetical protein